MNMKVNDELSPFLSDKKPNKEIEKLYDTYREQFIGFARKYFPEVDKETVIDIYQESFFALYKCIRDGKLTAEKLTVSLKTYLFAIGKNGLLRYIRDEKEKADLTENILIDVNNAFGTEWQEIINRFVAELDEPCNLTLTLFYFERKSLKEIGELMGYKSEQVAKNKRLSCMEKLKRMIKGLYNKEDFFDYE